MKKVIRTILIVCCAVASSVPSLGAEQDGAVPEKGLSRPYRHGFFPEIWPAGVIEDARSGKRSKGSGRNEIPSTYGDGSDRLFELIPPSLEKKVKKRNERHSWFFKSFREHSLKEAGPKATAFRFLWLRTFHEAICIRVDLKDSRTSVPVIRAETLTDGKAFKSQTWKLSPKQASALKQKFEDPMLWRMSFIDKKGMFSEELTEAAHRVAVYPVDGQRDVDFSLPLPKVDSQRFMFPDRRRFFGADWFLESWDGGKYKSVCIWSPKQGAVRDIGIILLKMVNLCPSDPREIY